MKATIKNNTASPKGFYLGSKIVTVQPGESLPEGDYEDGLLISLKKTGFDVDHKGDLKVSEPKAAKADTKAAKNEAAKIIDDATAEAAKILEDAKAECEKLLTEAKATADKMIAEAEELTKADK